MDADGVGDSYLDSLISRHLSLMRLDFRLIIHNFLR
jgi:hypothetical protein